MHESTDVEIFVLYLPHMSVHNEVINTATVLITVLQHNRERSWELVGVQKILAVQILDLVAPAGHFVFCNIYVWPVIRLANRLQGLRFHERNLGEPVGRPGALSTSIGARQL